MVLWTVDSFEVEKLCLLVGLVSATLGYAIGSHSQDQIIRFFDKFLPEEGNS